ncbi:MAG: HIT domain-containing protein [Bacteroidetes bacterium]|nr:HIT domain-containing protein [Bacteroidota bacterium]
MERLFSPWRSRYIASFKEGSGSRDCIFCEAPQRPDSPENLIVWRGERVFLVLNLYPYNSGHLMAVPFRHVDSLLQLEEAELLELWCAARLAIRALDALMQPHGYNVGMNLGRVAGAGIEDHVHLHVVPRWHGDTNFMPVLGEVKVISEALEETWKKLREILPHLHP